MRHDIDEVKTVFFDREIKTPSSIDPSLPNALGFVVFLRTKGRMAEITHEVIQLFFKVALDRFGRFLKGTNKINRVNHLHGA